MRIGGPPPDCDDGDACTNDTCDAGLGCVNTPVTCNDSNACTDDTCDPATGCVFTTVPDGTFCSDGDACTEDDACSGGVCQGVPIVCDDDNECTADGCDSGSGCDFTPLVDTPCDDGDPCTVADECDGNYNCVGRDNACPDASQCTDDACDPQTGECTHTPHSEGCDDGDPCTSNDECVDSVCQGELEEPCDPGSPCEPNFVVYTWGFGEGVPYSEERQMTIPQGTGCILVRVYYISREYPV